MPDLLFALRWWLVLLAVGAAATPLTWWLFGRFTFLGYPFTKLLGLLLAGWIFWLAGSLGFLQTGSGSALLAVGGVAALSAWVQRYRASSLRETFRAHRHHILLTELLFLLLFTLMAWVRAQNPQLLHTEKPMEIAFLNAIGRSATFPPLDPWLSGFAISYYYFGYVMTALVARLALVPEAVAFNLAIAWLFAATGVGAFGLVSELVARSGARLRWALGLGLVAALALPLAGNLQILLEAAHGRGSGSADLWAWIDIRDLNTPPDPDTPPRYDQPGWWWWRASRPINEQHLSGRAEPGLEPIVEFPAFSFLLGDLHPHVMALPFAFLSLALALAWYLGDPAPWRGGWRQTVRHAARDPRFWLTALVVGGLSFLNTWDVMIHLFVMTGAFALAWRRSTGGWDVAGIGRFPLLLGLAGILLYLPFYIGFNSQAGPPFILPMLMRPTRLLHFLVIFGMPLVVIVPLVIALARPRLRQEWRNGLLAAAGLVGLLLLLTGLMSWVIAGAPDGAWRITALADELQRPLPEGSGMVWAAGAVLRLLPAVLMARLATPWLVLLLAALIGGVVVALSDSSRTAAPSPGQPRSLAVPVAPFVLLLVLTGSLLTIGPEFLYIKDNFGQRLNTVFKFYYQAWALFGVAAPVGLALLAQRQRPLALISGTLYALLLAGALLFPYKMGISRANEYGGPATLDGMAHLALYHPDERAAIEWLRSEVRGTPVILEAVGGQYSEFGRIAAFTGLPTVLGWAGHQYQWRGNTPEPAAREQAISRLYNQSDWNDIPELLAQYEIDYIVIGRLERATYAPEGLEKFALHLRPVFQSGDVTIYAR